MAAFVERDGKSGRRHGGRTERWQAYGGGGRSVGAQAMRIAQTMSWSRVVLLTVGLPVEESHLIDN